MNSAYFHCWLAVQVLGVSLLKPLCARGSIYSANAVKKSSSSSKQPGERATMLDSVGESVGTTLALPGHSSLGNYPRDAHSLGPGGLTSRSWGCGRVYWTQVGRSFDSPRNGEFANSRIR